MPKAKKAKPLTPEEYSKRVKEMRMKLSSPDYKDYKRTIAGRGDTHALDGGKIPFSKTKKGQAFKNAMPSVPNLPIWQDRDVSKRGSKLGG